MILKDYIYTEVYMFYNIWNYPQCMEIEILILVEVTLCYNIMAFRPKIIHIQVTEYEM